MCRVTRSGIFRVHSPPLEPEEPQNPSQAHLLLEDLSDGHAGINELLATLVADAGHEGGGLTNQAQLLGQSEMCGQSDHCRQQCRQESPGRLWDLPLPRNSPLVLLAEAPLVLEL